MDPQTTWNELLAAYEAHEWSEVNRLALDLLTWLLRGGFPPDTGGDRATPEAHRKAARRFCIDALGAALSEQGHDVDGGDEPEEGRPDDA